MSAADSVMSRSSQGTLRSSATRRMTSRASSHRWQPGRLSRVIRAVTSLTTAAPAGVPRLPALSPWLAVFLAWPADPVALFAEPAVFGVGVAGIGVGVAGIAIGVAGTARGRVPAATEVGVSAVAGARVPDGARAGVAAVAARPASRLQLPGATRRGPGQRRLPARRLRDLGTATKRGDLSVFKPQID